MSSCMGTCFLSFAVAALAGHTALVAQATPQTQAAPADVVLDGGVATRFVDRTQLMRDIETLAAPVFEGRRTGTPGALRARQWLVDQFAAIGLASGGTEGYVQPFTFGDRERNVTARGGRPTGRDYSGANVIGHLAGQDSRARRDRTL